MHKKLLATLSIVLALAVSMAAVWPAAEDTEKSAGGVGKLPDKWSEYVTVKDLTDELSESATRMGQNLKKPSDFDKFLKNIGAEGHLTAVLAALVQEHPESGKWRGAAAQIQEHGLAVAKAAEAKGSKNFRTAQDAHKKITELVKKGDGGSAGSDANGETSDWASLGDLGDVMKRVDPCYKYIRGKMSNAAAFKKDSETIRHNAAMIYIFAQISPAFRPQEKDMVALSAAMSSGAANLIDAVKASDFAKANEANAAINASCNDCHKAKRFQKKGSDLDF